MLGKKSPAFPGRICHCKERELELAIVVCLNTRGHRVSQDQEHSNVTPDAHVTEGSSCEWKRRVSRNTGAHSALFRRGEPTFGTQAFAITTQEFPVLHVAPCPYHKSVTGWRKA
jgi:hypothetical protein